MQRTKDILAEINTIKDKVLDGEANKALAYYELYLIQRAAKDAINTIKEECIGDVETYGREGFECDGIRIIKSSKTTWSYDHIEEWRRKNNELKELESIYKTERVDEETGEVLLSATKKVSEFLKVQKT